MKLSPYAWLLVCLAAPPAFAQTTSHWGVAGSFVPTWKTDGAAKDINKLVIEEESLGISGGEFRIGLARGRRLSGDWAVSFVRRTIEAEPLSVTEGSGCSGSGVGTVVYTCDELNAELTPDNLRLDGLEVSKFIAFATIRERVQIGMNVAGGIGWGKGTFRSVQSTTRYTCSAPIGQTPQGGHPCEGRPRSNVTTTQTGTTVEPFSRILTYDDNRIPLGKVEVAVSVIVAPQIKVRFAGGLNYPGTSVIGVTGLFFFGSN